MKEASVLVVDDEKGIRDFLERLLLKKSYQVTTAATGGEALSLMDEKPFDLALLDLKLPDTDGLILLKHLKEKQPLCPAIIITAYSTIRSAVEAIQIGAYDYLDKPFTDIQQLYDLIHKAISSKESDHASDHTEELSSTGFVVGKSKAMRQIKQIADVIAPKDITVLIQGETGTGKEVLARYIHSISTRADKPFIAVNCGAFTESLLESELFGHEKGAFTGATNLRQGIFEIANQGTLFLDEISEASLNVQVKLLRVLETGEYFRVGGKDCLYSNIRIIAATNINLEEAVKSQNFRKDLLYRLDVARLNLPPLRERIEDIAHLVSFFLQKHASSHSHPGISEKTLDLLASYSWPGNIRELSNVIAHSLVMSKGQKIKPFHLPEKIKLSLDREAKPAGVSGVQLEKTNAEVRNGYENVLDSFLETLSAQLIKELKTAGTIDLPEVLDSIRAFEGKVAVKIIKVVIADTLGDRQEAANKLNLNTRSLRYLLKEKRQN